MYVNVDVALNVTIIVKIFDKMFRYVILLFKVAVATLFWPDFYFYYLYLSINNLNRYFVLLSTSLTSNVSILHFHAKKQQLLGSNDTDILGSTSTFSDQDKND